MTTVLTPTALESVLAEIDTRFKTHFEPTAIDETPFDLLQIDNMAAYVDSLAASSETLKLPLWAKVWPSSMLAAYALKSLAHAPGSTLLELGSGLGLTGMYAAHLGFAVTLSDYNADSLLFARANILKNGLEQNASVQKVDFTKDNLGQRFDCIIGSEILYKEETHRPLLKFLLKHLAAKPHAEVMLSLGFKRNPSKFFKLAEKEFHIQQKIIGYKENNASGAGERKLCAIYRLKPRKV